MDQNVHRYLGACMELFDSHARGSRRKKKAIRDAWKHCKRKNTLNGCKTPKKIRAQVREVWLAIRAEKDKEARTAWRKDVNRFLKP